MGTPEVPWWVWTLRAGGQLWVWSAGGWLTLGVMDPVIPSSPGSVTTYHGLPTRWIFFLLPPSINKIDNQCQNVSESYVLFPFYRIYMTIYDKTDIDQVVIKYTRKEIIP